jgi:hypothetical protein
MIDGARCRYSIRSPVRESLSFRRDLYLGVLAELLLSDLDKGFRIQIPSRPSAAVFL